MPTTEKTTRANKLERGHAVGQTRAMNAAGPRQPTMKTRRLRYDSQGNRLDRAAGSSRRRPAKAEADNPWRRGGPKGPPAGSFWWTNPAGPLFAGTMMSPTSMRRLSVKTRSPLAERYGLKSMSSAILSRCAARSAHRAGRGHATASMLPTTGSPSVRTGRLSSPPTSHSPTAA